MRKCRICECTDADGCSTTEGCHWQQPDLCSVCWDFIVELTSYMTVCGPSHRQFLEHKTEAVQRAIAAVFGPQPEETPEPLIVLAKS